MEDATNAQLGNLHLDEVTGEKVDSLRAKLSQRSTLLISAA